MADLLLENAARVLTLIQSLAYPETVINDDTNVYGWTGPGSNATTYAPTESWTWGSSGSGVMTFQPIAGMFGMFLVRMRVNDMHDIDLRLITKNAAGGEVLNQMIYSQRGEGSGGDWRIVVGIPIGGKVELHWYMKSSHKSRGRFYASVHSDNKTDILEYYLVTADLNTPQLLSNIAFEYDPRTNTGGVIKNGYQSTIQRTDYFAPICMYGTFLFVMNGVEMAGMQMKVKVYDSTGVNLFEEVLIDFFDVHKSFKVLKVLDVPMGGYVQMEWAATVIFPPQLNYTYYVDNRNRPPPIPVQPEEPEIVIEEKTLNVNVALDGVIVSSASQIFEYETTNSNTVTVTNELLQGATHICLWDYFLKVMGRRPQDGEGITFVVPEDVMLVAPYQNLTKGAKLYTGTFFNEWSTAEQIHYGCGAIDTLGWDPELRNFIKLDIRGKVIGSFPPKIDTLSSPSWIPEYPNITLDSWMNKTSSILLLDDATGEKLSYEYLRGKGFANPYPYYNSLLTTILSGIGYYSTNGVKQPAIRAHVSLNVVVRNGGYVIGGGGYRTTGEFFDKNDVFKPQVPIVGTPESSLIPMTQNDPRDLNGCDDIWGNGNGGDAIWVDGRGISVQVENYGYISGGGGGGESLGADSSYYSNNDYETFTPAVAAGGGAPFGGFAKPHIPIYVNLEELRKFSIETIDVRDNNFRGTSLVVRPIPASSNIKDQTGVSCPIEESQKVVGLFNTHTSQFNYSTFTTYGSTRALELRKIFNLDNFKFRKRRAEQADGISPTVYGVEELKASWNDRGLQASLGQEYQNTTAHYRTGAGGTPGVSGQAGTVLRGGSALTGSTDTWPALTLDQRRVGAGVKGLPVRYFNGASEAMNFTLVEHPGSVFNR